MGGERSTSARAPRWASTPPSARSSTSSGPAISTAATSHGRHCVDGCANLVQVQRSSWRSPSASPAPSPRFARRWKSYCERSDSGQHRGSRLPRPAQACAREPTPRGRAAAALHPGGVSRRHSTVTGRSASRDGQRGAAGSDWKTDCQSSSVMSSRPSSTSLTPRSSAPRRATRGTRPVAPG